MLARSTLSALVALLSASTFVAAEAVATLGIQGEGVSVVWTSVNAITQNSVQRITQKTLNQDPVRLTVRLGKDLEHPDIETTCHIALTKKLANGKVVTRDKPEQGTNLPFVGGVHWAFSNDHRKAGESYLNVCGDPCETGVMMVCGSDDRTRANCKNWDGKAYVCPDKQS